MQVIEAPNNALTHFDAKVFLGGGISNCPDWQKTFIQGLQGTNITVYNPRRANFDVSNPKESEIQITWEYRKLRDSNIVVFWFPKETLCPITLFELGAALERDSAHLVIGCHPQYKRKFDVEYQTSMKKHKLVVQSSLKQMVEKVKFLTEYIV